MDLCDYALFYRLRHATSCIFFSMQFWSAGFHHTNSIRVDNSWWSVPQMQNRINPAIRWLFFPFCYCVVMRARKCEAWQFGMGWAKRREHGPHCHRAHKHVPFKIMIICTHIATFSTYNMQKIMFSHIANFVCSDTEGPWRRIQSFRKRHQRALSWAKRARGRPAEYNFLINFVW